MKILQVTDASSDPFERPTTKFNFDCAYTFIIQHENKAVTRWGEFEDHDYTEDRVLKNCVTTILNN